jgi:ubiquinone biosynthesis monooxygenase Coq7
MQERRLTPLDRLLSSIDNALRTVSAPAGRPTRDNPAHAIDDTHMSREDIAHSAGLMRVNHAGEVAAQGLYQGHSAVARDPRLEKDLQQAADEEFDHLAWCEQRLGELGQERSRLTPLWYAGAFAIGAVSGILGDRWSLGFIAETERQVCSHLSRHLERLPDDDTKSRAIVEKMRDEEAGHCENAISAGARQLPLPFQRLMAVTARVMTRTAYWI